MSKFEDDGRTVVPMDMLDEGKPSFGGRVGEKRKLDFLRGREARQALFAAAAAALVVGLVFGAGIIAFVWFCTNIWFR